MNLDLYLKRLSYNKKVQVSKQCLFEIQKAQLTHIPFENIDCLNKKVISLEISDIESKILIEKRGGYCFELNLLFQNALKQIGFEVRPLLCRSMWRGNTINSKTHIALLVELGSEKFICDAGFGGPGFFEPIPFISNLEFDDQAGTFRIVEDQVHGFILQKKNQNTWLNVYAFNLDQVFENDLFMSNYFTSAYADSFFRKNLVVSLFTETGRKTLMNNTYTVVINKEAITTGLQSDIEVNSILEKEFGLKIN